MMELVPVILAASGGSRMTSLTSHCPKPLLPIGSYPMIYYPVSMLERLGFRSVILVLRRKYADEIRMMLTEVCGIKMKLDIITVPDQEDIGTAQMLKLTRSKIPDTSDILVMGCDFVSDINLNKLLHLFREKNASAAVLMTMRKESLEHPVPSARGKAESAEASKEDMMVFHDEESRRVVSFASCNDIPKEGMEYPGYIFAKFGCLSRRTELTDCHVYVLKRWILEYLSFGKECDKMKSIKYQLLPFISSKQFPSKKTLEKSRAKWKKQIQEDPSIMGQTSMSLMNKDSDIYRVADVYTLMRDRNCYEAHTDVLSAKSRLFDDGDGERDETLKDLILSSDPIQMFVQIEETAFCERTNTPGAYCEANRQISRLLPTLVPQRKGLVSSTAALAKGAQVGNDCIVGEETKLGEKASVKKSVVGNNCEIKDKVKITYSIIMDQVTLNENCTLMNCIVFNGVNLAEACDLKDCIVAPQVKLSAYGKFVNEVITSDPKK